MIFVNCLRKHLKQKCVDMIKDVFHLMSRVDVVKRVKVMESNVSVCIFYLMFMYLVKNVVVNATMKKHYR